MQGFALTYCFPEPLIARKAFCVTIAFQLLSFYIINLLYVFEDGQKFYNY